MEDEKVTCAKCERLFSWEWDSGGETTCPHCGFLQRKYGKASVAELINHLPKPSAITELSFRGDTAAVEPLINILGSCRDDIKQLVICALGELRDKRAIEKLKYYLNEDDTLSGWAGGALLKIDMTNVEERVLSKINDFGYYSVDYIFDVLKEEERADAIIPFLTKGYPHIKELAAKVLDEMGWQPSNDEEKNALEEARHADSLSDADEEPAEEVASKAGEIRNRRKRVREAVNREESCFIATAAMGDQNHPDVLTLRRFRNQRLEPYILTRYLVRAYYILSPPIAKILRKVPLLRWLVRELVVKPIACIARWTI